MEGFIIFFNAIELTEDLLTDAERGALLLMVRDYADNPHMLPHHLPRHMQACFNQFRRGIDKSAERYEKRRQKNRENAMMRWHGAEGDGSTSMQSHTNACDRIQSDANGDTDALHLSYLNLTEPNLTEERVAAAPLMQQEKSVEPSTIERHPATSDDAVTAPLSFVTIPDSPAAERKRFTPPTLEEVRAYCAERGNQIDPEMFIDFYEARGWKLSRGAGMKDWKAAVRTWEKREQKESKADDEPWY